MQDTIINRFDLRKVYGHRYYKETRRELSKNTKTEEERKSGVITISVVDKDPARAAQMVDAYLQEISRLSNELNTSAAHNERVFIEQRLGTVKQDLADASKALSEFSTKNATIDISVQGRSMIEGAAALQGQLIAARSELQGLQQIYTADNIRVKSAQARIAELQRQLDKIGGFKDVNRNPEEASAQDIYPSIKRLPELALRYTELYRRAKMQEVIFTLLTQQFETAKIQEARELPIIKVLDNPDIPEKKDSPSRTLIVLLTTLAVGIGASIWVLARHQWNKTDDDHTGKLFAIHVANSVSRDLYDLTRGKFGRRRPESNA
jgi:capsule polysaccharide export protein KpsE/RkpR